MKNKILGAAVLASTFALPAFATDVITFDADGSLAENSSQEILTLDWDVGGSLADNAVGDTTPNAEFMTYSHATLSGVKLPNTSLPSPTGLNSSYEITFIAGFSESVDSVTQSGVTLVSTDGAGIDTLSFKQTVTLSEGSDQTVNFFQVYYDDISHIDGADGTLQSNALTGLGFNDGDLILEGTVGAVSGQFTTTFVFVDANDNGSFDVGETLVTVNLDQAAGDSWSGQQTVIGSGATQLEVDVTFQDINFFQDDISGLLTDLFFNTLNDLPFDTTNPSNSFDDGLGGTISITEGDLVLGLVNGATGPDFIFQTDANQAFVLTRTVPEPGAMMLFGLGLFALGFSRRRKLS